MAIKERKQITGTEAQIKGYAGHNGVLAYATDTKHLHVLSGTAGTTTELANRTDIPDITGKADKTYVDTELAKKQTKGDYATNTALTQGLAGKANSSHTHTKSQITDFPSIPDVSTLIPKTGDGGTITVYETMMEVENNTISIDSPSILIKYAVNAAVNITLSKGVKGRGATKILYLFDTTSVTFTPQSGVSIVWANNKAPTFKKQNIIILTFHNNNSVFANLASSWD
jgi:hypothetical protein